jgi:hypothetical protein
VIQNYGNDPGNLCAKRTVLRKHNLKHLLDLSGSNITNQGAYFRKYFSFHRLFAKKYPQNEIVIISRGASEKIV